MDQTKKNNTMNGDSPSTSSSFSKKIHSSLSKICCFRRKTTRHPPENRPPPASAGGNSTSRLLRSSTAAAEIKDKCRRLFHDIGGRRHRRRHSADFRYDALSYSRNFDDGGFDGDADGDEFRFRSFSSRLPQSPPRDDGGDGEEESGSHSGFASTTTTPEIVSANGR